jgi:hypothetical protein
MSYDRKWLEETGSDDCHGRAVWALGACAGRSKFSSLQIWAVQLFNQALPALADLTSPRSWAFGLFGIRDYLIRFSGDRMANQIRDLLAEKLIRLHSQYADEKWNWFEDVISYNNAVLPHSLIVTGSWIGSQKMLDTGLNSLKWLLKLQTSESGIFRPVGSEGFYRRNGVRAEYDQQPLEAYSMVLASLDAYRATDDQFWLDNGRKVFEWFLGRNDLGIQLYDFQTYGCHDALHIDRINLNQGGESTLAFLLSLAELHIMENSLKTFNEADDIDEKEVFIKEQKMNLS